MKACLLCYKPASTFTVALLFLQPPSFYCTWSKSASGPEFPAPINPMLPEASSLRPLLSRNQLVPVVYMYFSTLSCSLTPPPPPSSYVGLTTWWNRISGSAPSFLCAKARWVVSCECLNRLYIPTVHIVRRYQILGGKRFEEKSVLNTILDFEGTPTRWPEIFKAKKNPPVFKKVSSF